MAFVPYVPPQPPSPRAQEMGQRFALTIAEFRQKYPDLSEEEVRQALALASERSPERERPATLVVAALVAAVAAAGLGVFFAGGRASGGGATAFPVIVGVGVALFAVVVSRRRRE